MKYRSHVAIGSVVLLIVILIRPDRQRELPQRTGVEIAFGGNKGESPEVALKSAPSGGPVTILRPLDSGEIKTFVEMTKYFDSLNQGSPDIVRIRSFVRDNFELNRSGLVKWLMGSSNEDKLFLNAYREFGIMAVRNGYEEDYQELFATVSDLKSVALLDGVVLALAERNPIAAFEYRENFQLDIRSSHVKSDSLLIGRAISYGKGKEALEAVQRFVPASGRTNAVANIFHTWADHKPASAVPHLDAITDASVKKVAMERFYNRWATRDRASFEEWLNGQQPSKRDEVTSVLVEPIKR